MLDYIVSLISKFNSQQVILLSKGFFTNGYVLEFYNMFINIWFNRTPTCFLPMFWLWAIRNQNCGQHKKFKRSLPCLYVWNNRWGAYECLKLSTHLRTSAGIIWLAGAASIIDCHVFVESGMTNPNSKNHSVDTQRNWFYHHGT